MSQRIVVVNSDGAEQAFGTAGSNGQAPNAATEVVLVNSDGTEQTVVSAGSTSPIPASYAQVVVVNSAGVEQTIGTVGSTSPIPAKFVQGVMVDESGSEVTVTSSGGVTPIPAKFRRLLTVNSDGTYQPFTVGTPVSLTLSGNEITDAVRAAGLSGDGLSPEGSTGIWEATTNLFPNGGFETNTSGWAGVSGTSISRVTSEAKFGAACLKVVTPGSITAEGATSASGPAAASDTTTYSASAWVKGQAGATLEVRSTERLSGALVRFGASSNFTATGDWQRISYTWTTGVGINQVDVQVLTRISAQATTYYVDGVQVEQQPLATPYVETDGGTASRGASAVTLPVAAVLDETQGWVAFRFRITWSTPPVPSVCGLLYWADDSNNRIQGQYDGTWLYMLRRQAGAGGTVFKAATHSPGDTVTAIFHWTATAQKASWNGSTFASAANSSIPTLSATTAQLGTVESDYWMDANTFWVACGSGTLSDADAATIHANGNSDPTPGLFPAAADLTLIWKGIDSTARTY